MFRRVLLEVNTSGEQTKFGFKPDALREQIERLLALPRIQVEGLMTIAPAGSTPKTLVHFLPNYGSSATRSPRKLAFRCLSYRWE